MVENMFLEFRFREMSYAGGSRRVIGFSIGGVVL